MMRDRGGQDTSAEVIPITRSIIFWEASEVRKWLEHLQFDSQIIAEAYQKQVGGANLISMVNSDRLDELGMTKTSRAELLWNLERRIHKGDKKAGTAVDPRVFLGMEDRLAELQKQREEQGGGGGGMRKQYTPYSDSPDSGDAARQMVRGIPSPKRVAGAGGEDSGAGRKREDLLDLLSMDMDGGAGAAPAGSSPERAPEGVKASGSGGAFEGYAAEEGDAFLAIEAAPLSVDTLALPPAPPAAASAAPKKTKKKEKASERKKTFNLIDFDDEAGGDEEGEGEDEEEKEEAEQVAYSEAGRGPEATVFEVVFPPGQTPNILLEESQPGNKLSVKSFPKKVDGSKGVAELEGKVEKGDYLLAVNSIRLEGLAFNDAIRVLTTQGYPLTLRFRRVPKHLRKHNLDGWSVNALRTVLLEEGAELTGLERHAQLVAMAQRAFWNKPVPLPPAPPHVAPGTAAMINGDTSVCGWLLMKGPHDRELQRLFCDLHGNELLYHKPKGAVKDDTAGYDAAPAGKIDMFKMKLVATTRSSEEGHRDLRMVNQDDQVYLLSFAKEDALTQWMRKLNTAMIIGPGARTSGIRDPSAPYLVSKTHRSLTVMWLPPRQPYLNSVHSFQVAYKQGINPLKDWTMATDEAHSTKFTIKGLKEGEKYFVKVRAMHELERGQMVWGDWSEHSRPLLTDREVQRNTKPAEHIWILVHGLRGDSDDMKYLASSISSRHGSSAHVTVAMCNTAPFKTLDGIGKGGTRLYEEVMQTIDSVPSAKYISFVGHGLGGVYARYALRLLNDAGVFSERLSGMHFITLGTPHLGSLLSAGGMAGLVLDNETRDQLFFKDTDMHRDSQAGTTREEYGVGGGAGGSANSARGGGSGYYGAPQYAGDGGRGGGAGGGRSVLGGTRPPMLARMTGEDYLAPLRLFRRRVLYANVKYDGTVEYPSASVRLDDPFVYVPDTDLARMCSPHYSHVMANSSKGNLGGIDPAIARGPGGGFPTALAAAAPEAGMWEIMAQVLDSLGWERVDIFNSEGMSPYKDLVVASQWLNSEGTDIVRHLVDNSPNKPVEEGGAGVGQEEEEEEEEQGVVEDLISGLDDEDGAP